MAKKTNCTINGIPYFRKYVRINGERKMVYGESEKDWNRKVDEMKRLASLGVIDSHSTVGKAIDLWVYNVLPANPSIRKSTYSIYEGIYRNTIKDTDIMGIDLLTIKSINIQSFVNKMVESGKSGHAIAQSYKVLNKFFAYAESEGLIIRNPCKNVFIPKAETPDEIEVYSDGEIEKIYKALEGDRDRFLILLALATGMREGELAALQHFDMGKPTIKVYKQQITERIIEKGQPIKYITRDSEPKTDASHRELPLPKFIQKEYQKHQSLCKKEKLKRGDGGLKDDDYIFLSPNGCRLQQGQVQKKQKLILLKAEVSYKKFHAYRHTYITKLIQSGVNIVTVMQLAGHSSLNTTMRYTHIEMEHKEKAADFINQIFV